MRYLCHIGFSLAAAILLCAYWLPAAWQLPCAAISMALGIAALLCSLSERRSRMLLRISLCLMGAALGFGVYAVHWQWNIRPAQALDGHTVTAEVVLRETPQKASYDSSALSWLILGERRYPVMCYLDADAQPGDRLTGSFRLRLPSDEDDTEPGYLRSCGVYLTVFPVGKPTYSRPAQLPLRFWPAVVRQKIAETVQQLFSSQTAPWFRALLTNRNDMVTYADKNALKLAGLYHSICTSGMHVSVLLGAISLLCLRRRRLAALIGLPVCLFFWAMAGGTPSVSRAVVMQTLFLLAPLLLREPDTPTSLAAALVLILLRRPDSIAHLGLQLSFLSTAGIALVSPKLYDWAAERKAVQWLDLRLPRVRRRGRKLHWLLHTALSSLSLTLGALLLTTPLLAYQQGIVSVIGALSGLLCLPVITVCFAAGLPVSFLSMAALPLGKLAALPLEWLMRYVIAVTGAMARLPFSVIYLSSPYWAVWVVLVYGWVVLLYSGRTRPAIPVGCMALSACLILLLQSLELHREAPGEGFRLTVLDVGQGQCLILQSRDETCVIDCGGSWPEQTGEECARYLLSHGVDHIDCLLLTHYHSDHANGVPQLLERLPVREFVLPDVSEDAGLREQIVASAQKQGSGIRWVTEDLSLTFGSGTLAVFAPRSDADANEACVSVVASFGTNDILVTGDMDKATELRLCNTVELPDIEILIAGHHGSRYSNSETLLQTTRPEVVIVSAAKSSSYEHPHPETLARFAAIHAQVLQTSVQGTISIKG